MITTGPCAALPLSAALHCAGVPGARDPEPVPALPPARGHALPLTRDAHPQPPHPPLHGGPGRLRDEVSGEPQLCPQGPRYQVPSAGGGCHWDNVPFSVFLGGLVFIE